MALPDRASTSRSLSAVCSPRISARAATSLRWRPFPPMRASPPNMNCRQSRSSLPVSISPWPFSAQLDPDVQIEQLVRDGDARRTGHDLHASRRQCARDADRRAVGAQHAPTSVGHRDAHPAICRRDRRHAARCCSTRARRSPGSRFSRNMPRAWAARTIIECVSMTAC